jgi:hypothetical protein
MRRALAIGLCASLLGCAASSSYAPAVTARGELTLRYDNGFVASAEGHPVARGLRWRGLAEYVRCVPTAHDEAVGARAAGTRAVVLSAIGGSLRVLALGGLYGLVDTDHEWEWLGAGVGSAAVGLVLVGLGRLSRNVANGRAVDAVNFYNDAVGSLGATCADLSYPPPAGPVPPVAPTQPEPPLPPPPVWPAAPPSPPPPPSPSPPPSQPLPTDPSLAPPPAPAPS